MFNQKNPGAPQPYQAQPVQSQTFVQQGQNVPPAQNVPPVRNISPAATTAAGNSMGSSEDEAARIRRYREMLESVYSNAANDKDVILFAYYLFKTEIVFLEEQEEDFEIRYKACFCNDARLGYADGDKFSRLEQLYSADIYTKDFFYFTYINKTRIPNTFYDRCGFCRGKNPKNYHICPVTLCGAVIYLSKNCGMNPENVFLRMLGNTPIRFGNLKSKQDKPLNKDDIRDIDSKSAHGAYIMIRDGFFRAKTDNGMVRYGYINLTDRNDHRILYDSILDFWKQDSYPYEVPVSDLWDKATKSDGGRAFKQDPALLAAYFYTLKDKYPYSVQDIAYNAALQSTIAGLTIPKNELLTSYLDKIRDIPFKEEERADFIRLLNYIVISTKYSGTPTLPIRMIITSSDKDIIKTLTSIVGNAVFKFAYFSSQSKNIRKNMAQITVHELAGEIEKAPRGTTMILEDFYLLDQDPKHGEYYYTLINSIEKRSEDIALVVTGEKYRMDMFLEDKQELRKLFSRRYNLRDLSPGTVTEKLADKISRSLDISEEMYARLGDYVRQSYRSSGSDKAGYIDRTYENIIFNHFSDVTDFTDALEPEDIPYIEPPRTEEKIFEGLNRLVGLKDVKEELKQVYEYVKFNMKLKKKSSERANMHMVFSGSAGTGKTTVARLVAEILYSIGFIQENKLVICSGKDLIGEYLGQTTPKTARRCEEAYNGVLFIDEAYQLNPYTSGRADQYKEECIAELIQQMENNRDRLVVIFAGYTDEMKEFIEKSNSGMKSRIGRTIEFPDYSVDELMEIFRRLLAKNGMSADDEAYRKVESILTTVSKDNRHFGNARFVRSLYERSLMQHAFSTSDMEADNPMLTTFRAEDITLPQ